MSHQIYSQQSKRQPHPIVLENPLKLGETGDSDILFYDVLRKQQCWFQDIDISNQTHCKVLAQIGMIRVKKSRLALDKNYIIFKQKDDVGIGFNSVRDLTEFVLESRPNVAVSNNDTQKGSSGKVDMVLHGYSGSVLDLVLNQDLVSVSETHGTKEEREYYTLILKIFYLNVITRLGVDITQLAPSDKHPDSQLMLRARNSLVKLLYQIEEHQFMPNKGIAMLHIPKKVLEKRYRQMYKKDIRDSGLYEDYPFLLQDDVEL